MNTNTYGEFRICTSAPLKSIQKQISVETRIMKEPVILFVLQNIRLVSLLYKFLLKVISDQNCDYKTLYTCNKYNS